MEGLYSCIEALASESRGFGHSPWDLMKSSISTQTHLLGTVYGDES